MNFLERIRTINEKTGARESFFKPNEGKPGDLVCALFDIPNSNLRLYCIRFGNSLIILGGGGEKKKTIKVVDLENCSMCRTCVKDCQNNAITVEIVEDKFIFRIQTDGSLSPIEVLTRACDILSEKADKIVTFCEEGGS